MITVEDSEFDKIVANARAVARDCEDVMIKLLEDTTLKLFIQSFPSPSPSPSPSPYSKKKDKGVPVYSKKKKDKGVPIDSKKKDEGVPIDSKKKDEGVRIDSKKKDEGVPIVPPTATISPASIPRKRRSPLPFAQKPNTRPFQTAKREYQAVLDQPSSSSSKKPKTKPFQTAKREYQVVLGQPSSEEEEKKTTRSLKEKSLKKTTRSLKEKSLKKTARDTVKHMREAARFPPLELPMEVRNQIESQGGSEVKLVIQKGLFGSDLNKHHDRLTIPVKQVVSEFLREEEKITLDNKNPVAVRVIEPCLGEVKAMNLRQWKLKSSTSYAVNGRWYSIFERPENNMKEGDIIQVWSFRADGGLWFALVNLGPNPEDRRIPS